MTPIGQPCTCEPMTWLYFVFVQSVFVFVGGQTLALGDRKRSVDSLNDPADWDPNFSEVGRCTLTPPDP